MSSAVFRFHGELDALLAPRRRGRPQQLDCAAHATLKHAIESLGVPHTEVACVRVDSREASLDEAVADGSIVDVLPAAPGRDGPLRFLADAHLGALARRRSSRKWRSAIRCAAASIRSAAAWSATACWNRCRAPRCSLRFRRRWRRTSRNSGAVPCAAASTGPAPIGAACRRLLRLSAPAPDKRPAPLAGRRACKGSAANQLRAMRAGQRLLTHCHSNQLSGRCTTSTPLRAAQGMTWRCSGM